MSFDFGEFGGGLFGAGASIFGNIMQGKQQQQNAQNQFWYNLALQQQSQMWNKQMADTQYQRSVADLRAAGLNPILAAGGFSPAGGSAGGASVSQADSTNPTEGASSSAEQLAKLGPALGIMKEQEKKTEAEVKTEKERARNLKADTVLKHGQLAQTDVNTNLQWQQRQTEEARTKRETQTARREELVGPGNVTNAQTYVPIVDRAIKSISKPSDAQPNSAKSISSQGPYGGLPTNFTSRAGIDPTIERKIRNSAK